MTIMEISSLIIHIIRNWIIRFKNYGKAMSTKCNTMISMNIIG